LLEILVMYLANSLRGDEWSLNLPVQINYEVFVTS